MKRFLKVIVLGLGVCLCICGCAKAYLPIGLTFRNGFWSDGVLQVHNLSDKRILIHIHVEYPPTAEEKDYDFSIAPNETGEYGALEMGSWQFSPGGCGSVSVQGYPGKINFELLKDGHYRTW